MTTQPDEPEARAEEASPRPGTALVRRLPLVPESPAAPATDGDGAGQMSLPVPAVTAYFGGHIQTALERWWTLAAHGLAKNSRRAFVTDLTMWCGWAKDHGVDIWPVSQSALERFLVAPKKGRKASAKPTPVSLATIQRRLWSMRLLHSAIAKVFPGSVYNDPTRHFGTIATVRALSRWSAGRETPLKSEGPPPRARRQRPPLTFEHEEKIGIYIRTNVASYDAIERGRDLRPHEAAQRRRLIRDWALLLVARVTMARRDELARFRWEDRHPKGGLLIRSSKTDQQGDGILKALGEEAEAALERWRMVCGAPVIGPIFRAISGGDVLGDVALSGHAIDAIVRRLAAEAAVVKPEGTYMDFGAHSTRIGTAIDMVLDNESLPRVMVEGRWKDAVTVSRYIAQAGLVESAVVQMRLRRRRRRDSGSDEEQL